ncbi:hypothetical protein QZH41_007067 [Actinostola sp. cb2023]|nr:hypothetical protein QZH41_007067 [Actinostola sp. cb2023]
MQSYTYDGKRTLHGTAMAIYQKTNRNDEQPDLRYNYARMIPLYLAEMASLSESDPEIYEEFQQGNWIVNKNAQVAFCAVGADHALEHINRSMKVSGGLVGITLNESARAKFFLIAPELARLAEQANTLAGLSSNHSRHHHNLTAADIQREEKRIEQLTSTIKIFTNPFSDHTDLFNLVTKVVMTENAKKDLCQQRDIGRQLFEAYVKDRIQSGKVNLWSTMKKRKLLTWKSSGKTAKLSTPDKIVELQEDRSLFARMMMVCKSRPEIDIKEAVGQYEFSIVPRSLFAADGTMLHCSLKSSLMGILEKLHDNSTANANEDQQTATRVKVSIVDAMAEVQSLDKPEWIRNCSQLAEHFNNRIFHKYNDCDEVRVIFDRYDLPTSLKAATRDKRQSGQVPIYYRITDTTQIAKVPMKKLLSHIKTKMELTAYLGGKLIEYGENNGKQLVVAYGCEYQATHKDVQYLRSNQEEADTKMILHAVDASRHGATEVNIHSPDTDVFILAIRRYTELCEHTLFVTGRGLNHRVIPLKPIVQALGNAKTAALPAFHALSGADNTGIFAGRGKLVCWKAFQAADTHVISALCNLGTTVMPCQDTITDIEKFVCQLYQPKTNITTVKELRWFLFRKKQAQSDRLPPTQAALYEAILRSHYQLMVWNNDIVPNPQLPSPQNYGWKMDEDHWLPVMTKLPPAPEAIIQLVKCGCVKERCSTNRCQCRKAGLSCTDLCTCSDTESCENGQEDEEDNVLESGGDDDDDDSDGFDELHQLSANGHSRKRTALLTDTFSNPRFTSQSNSVFTHSRKRTLSLQSLSFYDGSAMQKFVNVALDKTPEEGSFPCTKDTHLDCIKQFTKTEMQSSEFCGGITDFIQCYNTAKDRCMAEPLFAAYTEVIDLLSKELTDLYSQNQMCTKDSAITDK